MSWLGRCGIVPCGMPDLAVASYFLLQDLLLLLPGLASGLSSTGAETKQNGTEQNGMEWITKRLQRERKVVCRLIRLLR
jgi:hypothetical protein